MMTLFMAGRFMTWCGIVMRVMPVCFLPVYVMVMLTFMSMHMPRTCQLSCDQQNNGKHPEGPGKTAIDKRG